LDSHYSERGAHLGIAAIPCVGLLQICLGILEPSEILEQQTPYPAQAEVLRRRLDGAV
jgi:hypothetical protein